MVRSILIGLLVALATGFAYAGGAGEQRVAGHKDLAAGKLDGVTLDEDGVVRPGPHIKSKSLDVPTAWCALHTPGSDWVGTGNTGLLLRIDGAGGVTRIKPAEDGLMVTALAPLPGGGVAAAVYPGGRVYRAYSTGEVKPWATLPVEFIWALVPDKRGGMTAACGTPGTIYSIDAFGGVDERAKVHDEHARCMTADGDRLLIGTAPKGLVLELRESKLRVLRDLEPQEVVGIVALDDGSLLVAANKDQVGGNAQQMAMLLKQVATPRKTEAQQKPADRAALQDGSILHLSADGGANVLWEQKKTSLLCLHRNKDGALAGTHPDGRVLRVTPGQAAQVVADLDESEASVIFGYKPVVVTSNPAVMHRFFPPPDAGGTWTSAPLDPGARARWGTVRVWGEGIRAVHYRSGETEEPDETWTDWAPSGGFDGERGDTGVTARFLQVRVTLGTALRAIEVVRRTPNAAPTVNAFQVAPRKPDPKTGVLKATPMRKLTWKAADPDKDRLRTTLRARRDGSPRWATLIDDKVLPKTGYDWDTTGWPDGRYRLELQVSDGPDNPADRARTTTETLASVRVDNTPPRVVLTARAAGSGSLVVSGEADDGAQGRIRWARVSINGKTWVQLGARDGLFDTGKEAFEATLPAEDKGAHDVVVQVADTEGNLGTAATVVELK